MEEDIEVVLPEDAPLEDLLENEASLSHEETPDEIVADEETVV